MNVIIGNEEEVQHDIGYGDMFYVEGSKRFYILNREESRSVLRNFKGTGYYHATDNLSEMKRYIKNEKHIKHYPQSQYDIQLIKKQ